MVQYMKVSVCMWECIKIRKAFFSDAHMTLHGIVIITDSFDVPDLEKGSQQGCSPNC